MSDAGFSAADGAGHEHTPEVEITAGKMLRSARDAAGLHVAALAVSMKIPVKKLEALEADRLDLLHDAVFVRALAASVCRALKIDPTPILNKLPLNSAPRLNPDDRGINAPFHSSNEVAGMAIPAMLTKPSTLIVLALVLAGIAVIFIPDIKMPDWVTEFASRSAKSSDGANQSQVVQPMGETPEATIEPVTPSVLAVGVSNSSIAPNTSNAVPASLPASIAASAMETSVTRAPLPPTAVLVSKQPILGASSPASAPTLPTTGTVVFKAKGSTWVKVIDAKGVVQLSKTIVDGEVVGASGTAPLSVVVGRVDVTDVEVRGKPFALTGVSKDNVARFEVK